MNLLYANIVHPQSGLEVSEPILGYAGIAKLRNISAHTDGKFKSQELNIC